MAKREKPSNQISENEFDDIPFPDLQVAHRPMIGPSKEPVKRAGRFPIDPLALPGTIGDTVRWIVRSSIRPQPEIALMNTLAALGAIFAGGTPLSGIRGAMCLLPRSQGLAPVRIIAASRLRN